MKYLRLFESFDDIKSIKDIDLICKKYDINKYKINDDLSIDVYEAIYLDNKSLSKIPIKFNKVNGEFLIYGNNLKSLDGCPKYVEYDFVCELNELNSLKGCPEYIGGDFDCQNNNIRSFEGFPKILGGKFYCEGNPIFEIWILFTDKEKVDLFNDYDIIRDGGKSIVLDRLNAFLEEIGEPSVKEVIGYENI